jgi:hypothetical protein
LKSDTVEKPVSCTHAMNGLNEPSQKAKLEGYFNDSSKDCDFWETS